MRSESDSESEVGMLTRACLNLGAFEAQVTIMGL